ncbi:hypothetical protein [Hugenholtzia roseola]|uniref:hypothetical protein n=1 Tax=Hugenholtzia roseola TaxID=1002 RepID=UPI0003F6BA52|nr:hypothetical protein [Hugenholtzia roseola]
MAGTCYAEYQESEAGNYIKVVMKGFLILEKYKPCWLEVVDLIQKHQCHHILVDMGESKVIAEENRDWLYKEYFPKAYEASAHKVFRVARIVAEDVYNQMSLKQLDNLRKTGEYAEVSENFKTENEALSWLLAE